MADTTTTHEASTGTRVAGPVARPQPLGVFGLPAGYLLIGDDPSLDDVRLGLTSGKLPEAFPPELAYYERALAGDLDGALAAITGDDPASEANRLVLDPSPDRLASLLESATALGDAALVSFAETIGFIVGLRPQPADGALTDGEFAAMAHAAQATLALEQHDGARAVDELELAAQAAAPVSKALAGQLMGQLANAQLDEGGTQRASVTFQAALDLLEGTDLYVSRAELHVAAGAMFQEMSEAAPRLMQQAINHYHQAMALVNAETAPETFAIANANLGLAYITMPMSEASDQLRIGVAVQSMREALNYFTPESHPDRWSSTQLNLANALVYMPSKHQAENIAEAVDLYEDVLSHRDRRTDPHGRARVLANQGNALAHLGLFDDAKIRLHEARAIFEEFEEDDAVRSVRGILDEIAKHESIRRQDAE
jgi:tetratricopeptide (TPR) repeat protein